MLLLPWKMQELNDCRHELKKLVARSTTTIGTPFGRKSRTPKNSRADYLSIDGQPTQEKLGLPLPSYPPDMKAMMDKSMTKQEYELKRAEEDMIVEHAEVCCYLMMIQKCQMAGGVYLNAIDPLSQIMKDEQNQADWIKINSPGMLAQLWPKIQSAVAASAPPFSL